MPVDVEGADYLVVLSSIEIIGFPETIGALARIFRQAGVSWTIPSAGFEATNVGVQIGSRDVAAALLSRIVDAAERLKVKCVISPECGHAYSALRWEGPNLLGRRLSASRWCRSSSCSTSSCARAACARAARTRAASTFHDPCQLVRRGGITEAPRRLMGGVSANRRRDARPRAQRTSAAAGAAA